MRIDDLIILGRTVPEDSKKYGVKICSAGYSPEMRSFIRLYPLPVYCKAGSRDMVTVEVERNKYDSRRESWALKTRDENSILSSLGKIPKNEIRNYLEKEVKTIDQLNQERSSIGVMRPAEFKIIMKTRPEIQDPQQMTLFDDFKEKVGIKTAGDYYKIPYLKTSEGKQRCFQLREWGIYELMRKYPEKITSEYIRDALNIGDFKDSFFVVGNINQFKNIWIVIKSFSFDKKPGQLSIF